MKSVQLLLHQLVTSGADRFVERAEELHSRPEPFAVREQLRSRTRNGRTLANWSEMYLPASHDVEEGCRRHHPLFFHDFERMHPSCRTRGRFSGPVA